MQTATELAESYREKLGLLPWEEHERNMLAKIEAMEGLTDEAKDRDKIERRQCGKSTKGMLRAIASAVMLKKPLSISSPSRPARRTLLLRTRKLVDQLGLDLEVREAKHKDVGDRKRGEVHVEKVVQVIYVDHYL